MNFDKVLSEYIDRYTEDNIPIEVSFRKLVNNLTNVDRATHLIHTYPAKLLMHIPYFFLNNNLFSKPGDIVLDPFCGSGTVLLEAVLSSRQSIGVDANPLARLISEVKASYYDIELLRGISSDLRSSIRSNTFAQVPDVVNVDYWFLPHIKKQLASILHSINKICCEKYRRFFLVCFSNSIKKLSLSDPRVSVPVKLKISQYKEGHPLRSKTESALQMLNVVNAIEKFFEIVTCNIERCGKFNALNTTKLPSVVIGSDAKKLQYEYDAEKKGLILEDNTVDIIITSPPYAGAQKYIRASSLNLGWLELAKGRELRELEDLNIGREHYRKEQYRSLLKTGVVEADQLLEKIHKINPLRAHIAACYLTEMRAAFSEAARVLKPGGYMVLVAANNQICGNEFKTQEYLQSIVEDFGLRTQLRLIDDIKSYGLMTKRNKTANIITREWVLIFKK